MSRGLLIALLVVIIGALIAIPLIIARRTGSRQTGAPAPTRDARPRLSAPAATPAATPVSKPPPGQDKELAADNLKGVQGQVSASALRTIRDRVEADPAEAARVVRRWLNEDR